MGGGVGARASPTPIEELYKECKANGGIILVRSDAWESISKVLELVKDYGDYKCAKLTEWVLARMREDEL
jgi:hypothetical protein